MSKTGKCVIVVALVGAVAIVISLKHTSKEPEAPAQVESPGQPATIPAGVSAAGQAPRQGTEPTTPPAGWLPRLVDLGADQCVPCKMMAPVLAELRREYADRLRVEFYDVWKDPQIGNRYGIRVIPTQIFYDARGRELWRHEGFISKEDILGKWKELGVDLSGGGGG